ncbi:MAG: hypothetical protein K2K47_06615 [Duncaniella sp.]|nr:hypothetical protein [Duncaniella sp.]
MSFWNGIKQAFGFSPGEEEDADEYDSSVPTYAVERHEEETAPASHPDVADSAPAGTHADVSENTDDLPGDIFDAVIELFNSTMPEFVSQSLNTEAQRKYIYDHISASLRARIAAAVSGETPESQSAEDDAERQQLMDTLSDAKDEACSLREEMRKLRSDAARQKRALTDRIADLDRRLNEVKAEKERIITSRKPRVPANSPDMAEKDETISRLNSEVASLTARIGELDAEITKQRTLNEQLELKASMSDTMINNLQAETSRAREELSKAETELAVAAQIQEKLELFEQVKERKDAKITELAEKVKQLTEQIENTPAPVTAPDTSAAEDEILRLRDENASLSHTIETNLYNQANSEMKLRSEIKQLRAELEATAEKLRQAESAPKLIDEPAAASAPAPRKRRGRPRKSRESVDGNIDSTDWLDLPESPRKFDPDFGYHEPQRPVVPENDAQLSLF